jgi:hypothetical protein
MISATHSVTAVSGDAVQAAFLHLLPRIRVHAEIYFRGVRCPQTRADHISETIGLAWKWFLGLRARGKDACGFPMAFASVTARAVRSGRRVCGQEAARDALSPVAQQRHGFTVTPLRDSVRRPFTDIASVVRDREALDGYQERLGGNMVTPPAEAAAFRLDFPQFLQGLSDRDRELAMFLSLGHSPQRAATTFGLSAGRVSQLRKRWSQQWRSCQGEDGGGQEGGPWKSGTA